MIIDGIEVQQHQLSYDKIIKNTLAQSDEMTIRFINAAKAPASIVGGQIIHRSEGVQSPSSSVQGLREKR